MRKRIRPPPRADVNRAYDAGAWFRQPVVWLGATILLASLLGCIVTIVLAWHYADTPIDTSGGSATSPIRQSVAAPPPPKESR